ncbi:MAG: UrcA family protein [Candidatus Andeanibacterium colombiense]|uniref:UrcA family protein n=1 Tax=Candidatus Andeanibacterium colombiense TaxID=3121345 RepID=A0AAJ6BMS0_9SPHN|nr:MAG: UrcA family protein [Sphingomonadaceae bacterium]
MRKLLITALIAAGVAGSVAAPAVANDVTIRVSADGLDLTRASDIITMKGRIDTSVRRACNKAAALGNFSSLSIGECVADGTAKAMAELDARVAPQS